VPLVAGSLLCDIARVQLIAKHICSVAVSSECSSATYVIPYVSLSIFDSYAASLPPRTRSPSPAAPQMLPQTRFSRGDGTEVTGRGIGTQISNCRQLCTWLHVLNTKPGSLDRQDLGPTINAEVHFCIKTARSCLICSVIERSAWVRPQDQRSCWRDGPLRPKSSTRGPSSSTPM
jgi:hypothetical protein